MRLAIFSDIHDNMRRFEKTLKDAERRQADQFINLGDVGHRPAIFELLAQKEIPCIFGNWEVHGWYQLPQPLDQWVSDWPATRQLADLLTGDSLESASETAPPNVLFCHATPDMPANASTTAQMETLLDSGVYWLTAFPRLHNTESAVWKALTVMETQEIRAAFHGHTHIQMIWQWTPNDVGVRQLTSQFGPVEFKLEPGTPEAPSRYLIGVGSCGEPRDGDRPRYALYDTTTNVVELCAI